MASVSPLASSKPSCLYSLECFCGPAHLQKVSLLKIAEEQTWGDKNKVWWLLVCFCNDSVSLKAKNTNSSWTQEFLLHCHLWCLQSTTHKIYTVDTPDTSLQGPESLRKTENDIEKTSKKMLMLQVQVVRNHCVQPGSLKNCRRASSRRLETAEPCCPRPLHCSWLRSFKESRKRHPDAINLITCHQILWSILNTNFYEIAIWP